MRHFLTFCVSATALATITSHGAWADPQYDTYGFEEFENLDDLYGDALDDYGGAGDAFSRAQKYSGKLVGVFSSHHHQVNGRLYVVDDKTLLLKDFTYDGQGRDAFFMGGGDASPNPSGFIIPNEYYRTNVLHR